MVTVDEVRELASGLERSYEAVVHGRLRLRVGQTVYAAFSDDERWMGFAFPKEERDALIAAEPAVYLLPSTSDLRYNWIESRMDRLDPVTMEERVCDAWAMCVPKFLVRERFGR